jgi:hypothetical protein
MWVNSGKSRSRCQGQVVEGLDWEELKSKNLSYNERVQIKTKTVERCNVKNHAGNGKI